MERVHAAEERQQVGLQLWEGFDLNGRIGDEFVLDRRLIGHRNRMHGEPVGHGTAALSAFALARRRLSFPRHGRSASSWEHIPLAPSGRRIENLGLGFAEPP